MLNSRITKAQVKGGKWPGMKNGWRTLGKEGTRKGKGEINLAIEW